MSRAGASTKEPVFSLLSVQRPGQAQANHELTFNLDHSVGANQIPVQKETPD
jgi:hypothetical protein